MAKFPRIKSYKFEIESIFRVPSNMVGRLDKIAYDKYGNYLYYKAIAAANNIRFSMGARAGIRPMQEALEKELRASGLSGTELTDAINIKLDNHISNSMDWVDYGNLYTGYISEVYENRTLFMPTADSARRWMLKYEYLGT